MPLDPKFDPCCGLGRRSIACDSAHVLAVAPWPFSKSSILERFLFVGGHGYRLT